MNKTNVKTKPSTTHRHDTPNNKTHIIKFRVTETEKMELQCTAKLLHLSLSTLIRRALHNAKIERTVVVAGGGEETLTAVSTLLAQCSRVGGNLNQLALLTDWQEGVGIALDELVWTNITKTPGEGA